jgi:hypothetical protein
MFAAYLRPLASSKLIAPGLSMYQPESTFFWTPTLSIWNVVPAFGTNCSGTPLPIQFEIPHENEVHEDAEA